MKITKEHIGNKIRDIDWPESDYVIVLVAGEETIYCREQSGNQTVYSNTGIYTWELFEEPKKMLKNSNNLFNAHVIIDKLTEIFPCGFVAGGFALDTWRNVHPKDIDFYIPDLMYGETVWENITEKIEKTLPVVNFVRKCL